MSLVNNVVLLGSCNAFHSDAFKELQTWLRQTYGGQELVVVETEVGGHKHLEADVAIAAFNHGPSVDVLLGVLKRQRWPHGAGITLAFSGQEDWGWTTHVVKQAEEL